MKYIERAHLLQTAFTLLSEHALCDHCLGRQFGWLGTDTTNEERGRSIKLLLTMGIDEELHLGSSDDARRNLAVIAGNGMFEPARRLAEKHSVVLAERATCYLCTVGDRSLFDMIPGIVEASLEKLDDIEFGSFLAGCIPSPELAEREDEMKASHGLLHGETLRSHFNREFGKRLGGRIQKNTNFEHPDIVVVYDMTQDVIRLQITPVFIFGRYRKLARGIPQSRWDCRHCRGRGCEACGGTGRMYPDSIAEYIGEPMRTAAQGTGTKLHAAGREDIDALMLGSGRPFVVEISEPKIRLLNLEQLTNEVNSHASGKVEIDGLEMSDRARSQDLKEASSANVKEYNALIQTEGDVSEESLLAAQESLRDVVIEQRTPNRVAHRRSDLVRSKHIYEVRLTKREPHLLEGFFRVQGGTYVKELISGDGGRTRPSLAELLGTTCTCVQLNVTAIHDTETDHNA